MSSNKLNRGEIAGYIELGITPRLIEAAYRENAIRKLTDAYHVPQPVLTELAKRWGIGRYSNA